MSKIIISESQARLLQEAGLPLQTKAELPSFMAGNPLEKTGYFVHGSIDQMLAKKNAEVIGYFSDDITSYSTDKIYSKPSKLIEKCKRLEEPIKDKLETICNNVVVNLFGIPSNEMKLECELVDEIPPTEQFHITPDTDEDYEYEDVDEMDQYDIDVNKRRIGNAISYGAASRMYEQSGKLWVNDVFDLDEELPHLYSKIMKINEYLVFNTNIQITDKSHKQGGTVETTLAREGEIPKVHSRAVIFPILVQETIRGVVELLSSYGLPDDTSLMRRTLNIADALENEPWNMRLGPIMWDCVCGSVEEFDTENFPYFFRDLVSLPTEEFEKLMKNVFAGTKYGKSGISELYEKSQYNSEYDKFANDLALKKDRNVIEDDYFSDEEVQEWDNGEM